MRVIEIENDMLIANQKAYNCSIVENRGMTFMFYRYEPPNGDFNTMIAVCQLDRNWIPVHGTNQELRLARWSSKVTTMDDPRAFIINGRVMIVYPQGNVMRIRNDWLWATSLAIAELGSNMKIARQFLPEYGRNLNASSNSNQFSQLIATEKNWSPFVYQGRFLMLYKINPMVVIEFIPQLEKTVEIQGESNPIDLSFWKWGSFIGGGTPLLLRGNEYVGFFHSFTDDHPNKPNVRTYHMGFYAISAKPPFHMTRMSRAPFLTAKDEPDRDLRGKNACWRPNCIYPCGFLERDGKVFISQGWQDCRCQIIETDWNEILHNVIDVGEYAEQKKAGLIDQEEGCIFGNKIYQVA